MALRDKLSKDDIDQVLTIFVMNIMSFVVFYAIGVSSQPSKVKVLLTVFHIGLLCLIYIYGYLQLEHLWKDDLNGNK